MIEFKIKHPELNCNVLIKAHRDMTYQELVNEIKNHTNGLNLFIDLNSIEEHGLGGLFYPLDLFYGKIGDMVPKINCLVDRFVGGYIKIDYFGISHVNQVDENNSRNVIIKITK